MTPYSPERIYSPTQLAYIASDRIYSAIDPIEEISRYESIAYNVLEKSLVTLGAIMEGVAICSPLITFASLPAGIAIGAAYGLYYVANKAYLLTYSSEMFEETTGEDFPIDSSIELEDATIDDNEYVENLTSPSIGGAQEKVDTYLDLSHINQTLIAEPMYDLTNTVQFQSFLPSDSTASSLL